MKRRAFVMTLLMGFLFITGGYGPERAHAADKEPPASPSKRVAASPVGLRRAPAKPAFIGRVVRINLASETLSLKNSEATVTFDASAPCPVGLSGLFRHTRGGFGRGFLCAGRYKGGKAARQAGCGIDVERPPASRQKKIGGLLRRDPQARGTDFDDVDANKDGKITPVELSVVIPDITLDWFQRHDANHDGYLNRAEFAEAVRQQKAPAKTR